MIRTAVLGITAAVLILTGCGTAAVSPSSSSSTTVEDVRSEAAACYDALGAIVPGNSASFHIAFTTCEAVWKSVSVTNDEDFNVLSEDLSVTFGALAIAVEESNPNAALVLLDQAQEQMATLNRLWPPKE